MGSTARIAGGMGSSSLSTASRLSNSSRVSCAARHRRVIPTAHRHLHSSFARREEGGSEPASPAVRPSRDEKESFKNPITRYNYLVDTGRLRADDHQRKMVGNLERLWKELKTYDPGPLPDAVEPQSAGLFGKLFRRSTPEPEPTMSIDKVPKGLYLYGTVGTGKTMLMDLFYSTLPPQFAPDKYGSTRIHFHSFMLDVLHRQHELKKKYEEMGHKKMDTMPEVARSLAAQGRVLCFDEFQVTDIVTAMILRQLFERLMSFGVVCFITSNRHPDELYINGIQRQSFIPAIELIKERFQVVDLNSGTDYRKIPRALSHTYYDPLNDGTQSEMNKLFESFTEADPAGAEVKEDRKLPLWGRTITVPESSGSVARFKFSDLCNKPMSAADYLEITGTYGTLFVEDIPRLGLDERDQARRFITFIDACYENKTKLFTSSEVPIIQIFSDKHGGSAAQDEYFKSAMEDMGVSAEAVGSSSLFTSDEELFAFARCVSRLTQMGTQEWSEESGLHREPARPETSETETHP